MCEVNLVVSSINCTMVILMQYIHHILYMVMDETTKFTSHMCHEPKHFVQENHVFL
jgi:hypothetical protein